ncbi:C40 family peptidase [Clostridium sp. JN-9]|uniref:C40 family peptidase n=1 Tax=Clostridium sp. JN-9 TaxID=2507159 RepID=UPI000FFE03FD|nr:C40 family peptidase [Clostridium sp. JN-9]QAT39577.1 peptidoglycan endopeptidase [Clostridium sp. JN-9]
MFNFKFKFLTFVLFLLTFTLLQKVNTVKVYADAAVNTSQQKVVMDSADIKCNKVIQVPEKASKSKSVPTSSRVSASRGGSVAVSRGGNPAGNGRGDIISYAYNFMGRPYVWGASGPSAFDCSGFTAYVYSAFGVNLPHYTGSQYSMGQYVSRDNLKAGDLVFFNTYGSISHVGIYVGGGQFIHASSGSHRITVSDLGESYYTSRYAGAKRILN